MKFAAQFAIAFAFLSATLIFAAQNFVLQDIDRNRHLPRLRFHHCDFQQIMAEAATLCFIWLRPSYGLFYPCQPQANCPSSLRCRMIGPKCAIASSMMIRSCGV